MKTVRFNGRRAVPHSICAGVEMDNGVEQIAFELPLISDGQTETLYWGIGIHADAVKLNHGVWTVDNNITQYPGEHECYIAISDKDTLLWHSEMFTVFVSDLPRLEGSITQAYPSAIQVAVDTAASAEQAAERAEHYANMAEMSAETHGFFNVFIDERGHLIYERTDSIDDLSMSLEDGRLIIEYPVEGVVENGG